MNAIFCCSDNEASWDALRTLINKGIDVVACIVTEKQQKKNIIFCQENHINLITPDQIELPIIEESDLLISFSYKKKLPAAFINRVPIAINFHPAPLPMYRGRGTTMHAILKGESNWGVTCHYLDEHFDTGNIIEIMNFPITPDIASGAKLSKFSWKMAVKLLNKILDKILKNESLPSYPQSAGSYYSIAQLQEQKRISLNDTADKVNQKINAFWYPPYEGAYLEIDGSKFYLINKDICDEINSFYLNKNE